MGVNIRGPLIFVNYHILKDKDTWTRDPPKGFYWFFPYSIKGSKVRSCCSHVFFYLNESFSSIITALSSLPL